MSKPVQTDMFPTASAVSIQHVTKTFEQWQRSGKAKDLLRNLIKPEKKTITALDDVSLEVKRGEFVAYAGPNGAGKSTTMKLLAGMLYPACGEINILGLSPQKNRIELMKRLGILFGNRSELWWDHPVMQSFEWKRVVWDIEKDKFQKMLNTVVELLNLEGILNTFARELSLGQRMRADLAMMLLHQPELILLDEPTLGLDVLAKRQMIEFLKNLNREENTTIVVTSHDMDDLEEMAQRIVLISNGKLAFDGSFEKLREVTGSLCRIRLTGKGESAPKILGGHLLLKTGNVYEYEVDTARVPVQTLLREIAAGEGIEDIEIRKAPIEQVIAELYTQWRTPGPSI